MTRVVHNMVHNQERIERTLRHNTPPRVLALGVLTMSARRGRGGTAPARVA